MLQLHGSNHTALDFFDNVDDNYGIHEEGATEHNEENSEGISVPRTTIQLSDGQMQQLQQQVNPDTDDSNFGIDLYQQALQFLYENVN